MNNKQYLISFKLCGQIMKHINFKISFKIRRKFTVKGLFGLLGIGSQGNLIGTRLASNSIRYSTIEIHRIIVLE